MARRHDILTAVYEADRLHKEFDSEVRTANGEGRIDVFQMLLKRGIPVVFRPLNKLLGAYIHSPGKGVLVTSRRTLPVQRFTAAHELGHDVLGHGDSIDEEEMLARALFVAEANYDSQELQANAFASELLTPFWLIAHHMKQQDWTRDSLTDPIVVYQLALRMGSSYSATCYALQRNKGIGKAACEKLLQVRPKSIKQSLLKPYTPEHWHGDVWLVTERDNGMVLDGSRSDLVVFMYREHSSSGYLWQFGELANSGLAIKREASEASTSTEYIGGVVSRTVVVGPKDDSGARGHVRLRETRPWERAGEPLHSLELEVELSGPIRDGLLPAQRKALLQSA